MNRKKWYFGANFITSNAVNQLEMWQEDSFNPRLIDRELGFAAGIGMNIMRIYLHDLLWENDRSGFLRRFEQLLDIADKHQIAIMPVFFDDCWHSDFAAGKQPDPVPFTHNSGWIQSPGPHVGDDPSQWSRLEDYVCGFMQFFAHDERIALWDLYNEPGNGTEGTHFGKTEMRLDRSLPLLRAAFDWARSSGARQPLTSAVWCYDDEFANLRKCQIDNSDVVSFHCYAPPEIFAKVMADVIRLAAGRPVICSEYLARTHGNTFAGVLPLMHRAGVGAINWGLVSGKTQTIYPWNWTADKGMPESPFHDIFRPDGTMLAPNEKTEISAITSVKKEPSL